MLVGLFVSSFARAGDPLFALANVLECDQQDAWLGYSVAGAGDVNGDGFADVVVGTGYFDDSGLINVGRAFLYEGSAAGLATSAAWTATGTQDRGYFAESVASAGDVNGDGFGDVIVGAAESDPEDTEGIAYLFLGSASGLESTASWTAESNSEHASFGRSVASAGDVNGDGFDDVVVGAPVYYGDAQPEGEVFVFLGSASGLEATPSWQDHGPGQGYAQFAGSVASAGDVNGDGYDDLVVGAWAYDGAAIDSGAAYLYLGSAAGPEADSSWSAESDAGAEMGSSVSSAGDVNGDGYDDVVVGAYGYSGTYDVEGAAYVFLGSATGLEDTASWTATGGVDNAMFGVSAASLGDVNGDGFDDVAIGAEQYDAGGTKPGFVSVFLGSASGLGATAAWTTTSGQNGSTFGYSVASAGDVDGDGATDLVAGAIRYTNGSSKEGAVFVYMGSEAGAVDTGTDDSGGGDSGTDDSGSVDDSAAIHDSEPGIGGDDVSDSGSDEDSGCGCGSTRGGSSHGLLAVIALAVRSRRKITSAA